MAIYLKGSIQYTPVVEQINRKFAVRKKVCSASVKVGPVTTEPNPWMGGATKTEPRCGIEGARKNYFVFRENARKSAVTALESEARTNFAQANAWVNAAKKDLSAISHNQHVMDQVFEYPNTRYDNLLRGEGYTYYGFMRAWAIKKLSSGGELPANHQMPDFPTV